MRPLLLLRPEPGLSASAAAARELGLQVIEAPLFEIAPVEWDPPDPAGFDALLLTSANAVEQAGAALARYRGLAAHAVGERTAHAARAAGLSVETVGSGGVESLLDRLPGQQRLLHLCGADRVEPTVERHALMAVPIYRSVAIADPGLPPLAGLIAAVHSPRAGARLAELARDRADSAIAAISAAAADACGDGWQSVEVAPEPSDSALLALAARLCQSSRT